MHGPDHFREGDRLLADVAAQVESGTTDSISPLLVAMAEAHYVAAHAAATAAFMLGENTGAEIYNTTMPDVTRAWAEVVGAPAAKPVAAPAAGSGGWNVSASGGSIAAGHVGGRVVVGGDQILIDEPEHRAY